MKLTGEVSGQASVLYRHQEGDGDGPIEILEYDVEGELNNSGFDFALRAEEALLCGFAVCGLPFALNYPCNNVNARAARA